jgi:hypothetical protein
MSLSLCLYLIPSTSFSLSLILKAVVCPLTSLLLQILKELLFFQFVQVFYLLRVLVSVFLTCGTVYIF